MHKSVLALLAFLLAVPASAQTLDKPTRISVFVSPGIGWSEGSGSFVDGGYGVALERRFSRAWSAELAVAREQHETQPFFFNPTVFKLRTHPIDVVVRYTFLTANTRWRPYVGAGARYVAAPDEPANVNVEYENELSPEMAGGVELNGGESWSVQFGLKLLVRNEISVFDEQVKAAIGVGWRF